MSTLEPLSGLTAACACSRTTAVASQPLLHAQSRAVICLVLRNPTFAPDAMRIETHLV